MYEIFLHLTLYGAEALVLVLHSLLPSFIKTTVAAHHSKPFLLSFKLYAKVLGKITLRGKVNISLKL